MIRSLFCFFQKIYAFLKPISAKTHILIKEHLKEGDINEPGLQY